jgi:hypothetical protein
MAALFVAGLLGLLAGATLAGTAAATGGPAGTQPTPDKPPPPPPPPAPQPPPPPPPPPPPAAVVAPPPPPAVPAHTVKAKRVYKPKRKRLPVAAKPPRIPPAAASRVKPQVAASAVIAPTTASSDGPVSMPLLLALGGLLLGLVAVGISSIPAWSLPIGVGVRLERHRQTIALAGLAIGVACAFVGLLNVVSGG